MTFLRLLPMLVTCLVALTFIAWHAVIVVYLISEWGDFDSAVLDRYFQVTLALVLGLATYALRTSGERIMSTPKD